MLLGVSPRAVTSVQDDVVDHVALVFGVVEAEWAAQVPGGLVGSTGRVARLHVNGEGVPEDTRGERKTDVDERSIAMWFCREGRTLWVVWYEVPSDLDPTCQ